MRCHGRAVGAALAAKASAWRLLGWSFRGSKDAVEIEIKVSDEGARELPASPTLRLPPEIGGRLRLRVAAASSEAVPPPPPPTFTEPSCSPVSQPLAPGAQILVGEGRRRRMGGVAALLVLDGRLHLLTCGHLFFDADTAVTCRGAGGPIAVLSRSYLRTSEPLDAAVCGLTAEGVRLLAASLDAPTWLRGYCEPVPEVNARIGAFWPTHVAAVSPVEVPVSAYSAATTVLFPRGPYDGFIELGFGVIPGDSGSLLAVDDLYLGLCSGQVQGSWSYFTPIAAALNRMVGDYQEVALWHPDDGPGAAV